jgi:hypothetical protein
MSTSNSPPAQCGMISESAVENLKTAYKDESKGSLFGPSAVIDLSNYESRSGKSAFMSELIARMSVQKGKNE